MVKNVVVRLATEDDAALLAEVGLETFFDTFASVNTPENMAAYLGEAFGPEIQRKELREPGVHFLIAEVDGHAVGYSKIKLGSTTEGVDDPLPAELERIYTRHAWIGAGVGKALMQASIEEAARLGAQTLWLGVWEHNPRAIAFYRKWGFVEFGTHIFQVGDDPQNDLLMKRKIRG